MPAPTVGIDYYGVLGLPRTAGRMDVQRAYRTVALRSHPRKNEKNDAKLAQSYTDAAEAYQVLSNEQLRAVYDQYGIDGLKIGVPAHGEFAGFKGSYEFNGDADEVFEQFFGTSNPFADFAPPTAVQSNDNGTQNSNLPTAYAGEAHRSIDGTVSSLIPGRGPTQDAPLVLEVPVTLEELLRGTTKPVQFQRAVFEADNKTLRTETAELQVAVPASAADKSTIVFARQGSHGVHKVPADVHCVVKQLEHPRFTREGNNLIYKHKMTLERALTGSSVTVLLLDNREMNISLQEIISPSYRKVVAGEGLMVPNESLNPGENPTFGDLVLTFDIEFPSYLSVKQKDIIKQVFAASSH